MLDVFNSENDAPAGKGSSVIAIESKNVMQLNTPTVWDAMCYLDFVRLVEKCRAVAQRVSISNKNGMQVAVATQ